MGRSAARLCLYPITAYFLLTAGPQRRVSTDYLTRVLGRPARWRDVFRHIHCFASTILDRVFFLSDRWDSFDVRVHNGEALLRTLESGRGCILLSAHVGSFEALRALGKSKVAGYPLKALMNISHNSAITHIFNSLNPEMADTIIPIGSPGSLIQVKESLDAGGLVGTLADRVSLDDKTTRCRFMGGEVILPAGPILLAKAMRAPVYVVFALYRGGNRYDVHFEPFADVITLERKRRDEDVRRWMQAYADRLEHYVRMAPYNWFNFYDYWRNVEVSDDFELRGAASR